MNSLLSVERALKPLGAFSHVLPNESLHQFRVARRDNLRNVLLREILQHFQSSLNLSIDGAV